MADINDRKLYESDSKDRRGSALVIGGGVGGMQAALDLAESGIKVYLLEKKPAIGGVMSQLDKTFPTNDCSMCIVSPRLVDVGRHLNIQIISNADICRVEGVPGNYKINIKKRARYVDPAKCTGCGSCVEHCPVQYMPSEKPPKIEKELDERFKKKIDQILKQYNYQSKYIISILQDINSSLRFIPPESLPYLEKMLKLPLTRIYHIATFYKAFSMKPRGEYVIKVCMGTACVVRGAQRVVDLFEEKLGIKVGETTHDLKFTLETVNCLGACAMGPVVTVNEDYHSVPPSRVERFLKSISNV